MSLLLIALALIGLVTVLTLLMNTWDARTQEKEREKNRLYQLETQVQTLIMILPPEKWCDFNKLYGGEYIFWSCIATSTNKSIQR